MRLRRGLPSAVHSDQTILHEQYELLRSQHSSMAQQHDEALLRVAELEEDLYASNVKNNF
eukprot:SAG11_NODE_13647_length_645_cov_1.316850_2_plen_60_part_00